MLSVRKDYFLDRYVYFAENRGKRPHDFKRKRKTVSHGKKCFFCPGNEHMTPEEIGRLSYKGGWRMRWFPNKFSAVSLDHSRKSFGGSLFEEKPAFGMHEVIVETNHHKSQLWDMPVSHIRDWLEVIKVRVMAMHGVKGIKYACVFKNHGKEAGASLEHSHSQIIGLDAIPVTVSEKIKGVRSFKKKHGKDPYDVIVGKEVRSKRRILTSKHFACFAPYASRFGFEAWIVAKKSITHFEEMDVSVLYDLGNVVRHVIRRLKKLDVAYNMFFFYSPSNEGLRFHIEIAPRVGTWAGFEHGSGFIINSVMPEVAAEFYRK